MEVKEYVVRVKHDKGIARFRTGATSEEEAAAIIMKVEGCPERAITSVSLYHVRTKKLQTFMKRLERACRLRHYDDIRDLLSTDLETTWDLAALDIDTRTEYDDLKHRANEMVTN